MRLAATGIAAFLLLIMAPSNAPAPAQDFGRVFGPLKSVLRGAIRVRPYYRSRYSYRSRARYARRPGASRAAQAQVQASQAAQARGAQMAQLGQVAQPEAFWPGASQDVFDFVLTPREDGLWAHGFGAVVVSMFTPPPKKDGVAAGEQPAQLAQPQTEQSAQPQSEEAARSQQTEGAAAPNGTGSRSAAQSAEAPACGEDRASHAEAITDWIRDTLALPADQRAVTQLRSALTQADNEITAGCPREIPSAVPDRLRVMQDRLWALRVAATNLRAPLQDFDKSLTNEQKAKLDPQPPAGRDSQSRRRPQVAQAAQAEMTGKLCYAQAQRAPQWPAEQIARAVRPNKEQQERLAALSETSSKMSMMMMGVCPQKPAETPQDRLNVALDWLDNVLLAAANVAVAVDDFYASLSDEQKSKLDTLSL